MAIIRSYGALQKVSAPTPTWVSPSSGSSAYAATYAAIYRTQPNVRTVVDFLARNVAQLGLKAYRRVSDTDREQIGDHPIAQWIRKPNNFTTRYRLFEALMQDLGIYLNAFWLKVRLPGRIGLVRLPPEQMTVEGGLFPTQYVWTVSNGQKRIFPPADVIHFGGYDPDSPLIGLSPIETLRQLLAEEHAAAVHRRSYWRNAARIEGVILRPKEAGRWTKPQRESFKNDWQAFQGELNTGKTPVLEDGMTWQATAHNAKDSELTATRKLTREEVTRAYHVPLPMAGILDHATYSNVKEQHKHLYADALGPWLVMIEEQLEKDLIPEAEDNENIYLEFNIAEKLKGSFEEQATAIVSLTGRPVMTLNEGRARLNLPSKTDASADEVAMPLNMSSSGSLEPFAVEDDTDRTAAARDAVRASFQRQASRLAKVPHEDRAAFFSRTIARWDAELATDLSLIYGDESTRIASIINGETLALLNAGADPFTRDVVLP